MSTKLGRKKKPQVTSNAFPTSGKESDESSSVHWSVRLRELLDSIESFGSYVYRQNLIDIPRMQPNVTIEGMGRVGFPLADVLVDAMIAVSAKAPFGKLDKTITDDAVRKAWQIDASMVTIGGGELWSTYFTKTVRECCYHLGISNENFDSTGVKANLYKLLIYEEGGHFLPHRDTEKEVGMFGTLIIQLPTSSGFTGGVVSVTHQGVTKMIDLSLGSDHEFHAIAFYADCEHQLHPVTNGKRVCLVFNLVASSLEAGHHSELLPVDKETKLQSIVEEWSGDEKKVEKLGYQLGHKYTHQSLGITSLKGRDYGVYTTLRNARTITGERLFRVSLLLLKWKVLSSEDDNFDLVYDDDGVEPVRLIEENADGSYEKKKPNATAWDMVCTSKNGWWVARTEKQNIVVNEDEKNIVVNEDEDEDELPEQPEQPIRPEYRMFESCYQIESEEKEYLGNEAGHTETVYYAAALVISPYTLEVKELKKVKKTRR